MVMRGRIGRRSISRGGAAVELVVVFPVVLLLLVGVIDYGRLFYTSVTVSNAARAGAEYGQFDIGHQVDTTGMRIAGQADGIDAGNITITARNYCECGGASHSCTLCSGGVAPEGYVEVTATKSVSMYLPYPGLQNPVTVTRTATFRSQ